MRDLTVLSPPRFAHRRRPAAHRAHRPSLRDRLRPLAFSAARAAVLIGIAVVIGVLLLQFIDDGTSGPIGEGRKAKSIAASSTTTTAPAASATTTTRSQGVRPPQQVAVVVLNGSGRPGAATAQTNALRAKGYQTLPAADAPHRQGAVVEYKPGYDREAAELATVIGGNPKVQAISSPPPTGSDKANCVVILGS